MSVDDSMVLPRVRIAELERENAAKDKENAELRTQNIALMTRLAVVDTKRLEEARERDALKAELAKMRNCDNCAKVSCDNEYEAIDYDNCWLKDAEQVKGGT